MPKLEAGVQNAVTKWAKANGWLPIRFTPSVERGWPDVLFIRNGLHVWIEFKAPGKEPEDLQQFRHRALRDYGAAVHTIDDAVDGIDLLEKLGDRA